MSYAKTTDVIAAMARDDIKNAILSELDEIAETAGTTPEDLMWIGLAVWRLSLHMNRADAAQRILDSDLSGVEYADVRPEALSELAAALPAPGAIAVTVTRGISWPVDLDTAIRQAADAQGVTPAQWVVSTIRRSLAG